MSKIKKLGIRGIRNFDDADSSLIEFDHPLTLILGQNGTGKTTIIESLRYALSGDFPPESDKGKTFIRDPSLKKGPDTTVRGNVKVEVRDTRGDKLTVSRTMELQYTAAHNLKAKTLDIAITRINRATQKKTMLSGSCASTEAEILGSMGISKPLLNYVLLCHQEDADWPFESGKKLKERFDEIFGTVKYNKAIENIRKQIKSEKTNLKVMEAELHTKKLYLEESNGKKKNLNNLKSRKTDAEDTIRESVASLEPINKRLVEISEIEKEYYKWQIAEEKTKVEYVSLLQQVTYLRENITEIFTGSVSELTNKLSDYTDMLANRDKDYAKVDRMLNENLKEEKTTNNLITEKNVTIGTLKQKLENQATRISRRNKMLKEVLISFDLDETISSDLSEKEAKYLIQKLEKEFNRFEKEAEAKREDQERKIEKLQQHLNTIRSERVTLESQITNNKREIQNVRAEISTNENLLKKSGSMDTMLTQIDSKLNLANKRIMKFEKSSEIDDLKSKLQEAVEREETNERENNSLAKEIQKLRERGDLQRKLEAARKQLKEKEAAIEDFKEKHSYALENSLGITNFPDGQMKDTIEEVQIVLDQRIQNLRKEIETVQREIINIESSVQYKKTELEKKTKEIERDQEKISKLCGDYANYRQVLSTQSQKLKEIEDKRGKYMYQGVAYKEYIEKLSKPNSSCPLCNRGFTDANEAKKLVTNLKSDMHGHPEHLKNYEKELASHRQKYDSLLLLQPLAEKIEKFENVDIKNLKQEIEANSKRLGLAKEKMKRLRESMIEPEKKISICKEIVGDMVVWDCHSKEIEGLLFTISDIQESVQDDGFENEKTVEEAEKEQNVVQQLLKETRQEIKKLQSLLDEKNEERRRASAERSKLLEEQLKIHKEMREIKAAKEAVETLNAKMAEHKAAIQDFEDKLVEVGTKFEIANRNAQQATKESRTALESDRNRLREYSKELDKLSSIQAEVVEFLSQKIEDRLLETETELKSLQHKARELTIKSNDYKAKLAEMKESSSLNETRKRNLMDNLELRKKEESAKKLKSEWEHLKSKLASATYADMSEERNALCVRRDKMERERNVALGQIEEVEKNIELVSLELQKSEFRNAEKNYSLQIAQVTITGETIKDLQEFCEALDEALIEYHEENMVQVNKCMKKLWKLIYTGNDTSSIEIRAQPTKTVGDKRQFIYKLVQVKNDVAMDMRGRCSAGQKVLASIVLRMALAEVFCNKCCMLALDEPTTNLDEDNARSLADALHRYTLRRIKYQKNFQLIVITHDNNFIRKLSPLTRNDSYYHICRTPSGVSTINRVTFVESDGDGSSSDEALATETQTLMKMDPKEETPKRFRDDSPDDSTERPRKKKAFV